MKGISEVYNNCNLHDKYGFPEKMGTTELDIKSHMQIQDKW